MTDNALRAVFLPQTPEPIELRPSKAQMPPNLEARMDMPARAIEPTMASFPSIEDTASLDPTKSQ